MTAVLDARAPVADTQEHRRLTGERSNQLALCRFLAAPEVEAPSRLLVRSEVDNEPIAVAAGDIADMFGRLDDEHRPGGVVAPLRSDLLPIDLDGCASLVLPELCEAADTVGAVLVYQATSGSPDSRHAAWAFPTAQARTVFVDAVAAVRSWAGLDTRAVDVVTGGRGLRLPGSASFKRDGGICVPCDLDGEPIEPAAALEHAQTALAELDRRHTAALDAAGADGRHKTTRAPQEPPQQSSPAQSASVSGSWRPRKPFTAQQQAALDARPKPGRRSEAAVAAWRALWDVNVRDWTTAEPFFDRPVFAKYRSRPDRGRVFWQAQVDRWANYRGPVDPADQILCDQWLGRASSWIDRPDLEAAVSALIYHRFTDGRGTSCRPIACRDLAGWLHGGVDPSTANEQLRTLVEYGVLRLDLRSGIDIDRTEAHHYTLLPVGIEERELYRGDSPQDRTPPRQALPTPLHPLWAALGQRCRQLYQLLQHSPPTCTTDLAAACGLPRGDHSYGTLSRLHKLVSAGLIVRTGHGRATAWTCTSLPLDDAADGLGVAARARAASEVTHAERRVWHAPDRDERHRALAVLDELRHACDDITTAHPDLVDAPSPPHQPPDPEPSPRPLSRATQVARAARTALTTQLARALSPTPPAETSTRSARKDTIMATTTTTGQREHPRPRRRTRVSRTATPAPWVCVTDAATFAQHLQAGRRHIEVRRTALDPDQTGLINLGAIPTDVEVRIAGCAAVLVTAGAVHATDTGHVEAHGTTTVHTYGRASATGFDTTTLTGHHHSQLQLCDRARATALDNSTVIAWDPSPTITAGDHTTVIIAAPTLDSTAQLHLRTDAHLYTAIDCTPTGTARHHITHTPDPFATTGVEPTHQ